MQINANRVHSDACFIGVWFDARLDDDTFVGDLSIRPIGPLSDNRWFISGVEVEPRFRRQGVATKLYDAACQYVGGAEHIQHDTELSADAVAWINHLNSRTVTA